MVGDHGIEGAELVPRKKAKYRFRESILVEWGYCCAYCAEPLGKNPTLDHVEAKARGGLTERSNLIACCFSCNIAKSKYPWKPWFRGRSYWTEAREVAIETWLEQ